MITATLLALFAVSVAWAARVLVGQRTHEQWRDLSIVLGLSAAIIIVGIDQPETERMTGTTGGAVTCVGGEPAQVLIDARIASSDRAQVTAVTLINATRGGTPIGATAIIAFATEESVLSTVEVDFANGVTFNVPGTIVQVSARCDQTSRLGAFLTLSPFQSAICSNPTRTFDFEIDGSMVLPVEPFAKFVEVVTDAPQAAIQVSLNTTVGTQYQTFLPAGRIPIVGDVSSIGITEVDQLLSPRVTVIQWVEF